MVTVVGTKGKFSFKAVRESWRFVLGCVVAFGGILYLYLR
jgi:hypothetical protein